MVRCNQDIIDWVHNDSVCRQQLAFQQLSENVVSTPPCCCVCVKRVGGALQDELAQYAFTLADRDTIPPPIRPPPTLVQGFKLALQAQLYGLSRPMQEAYVMVFKSGKDMQSYKFMSPKHRPVVLQALQTAHSTMAVELSRQA